MTSWRSRASAPPGRTPAPAQGQRGSGMGEKRVGPSTNQYKPVCPSTSQGPPQHIPVPPQYIPVHPSNLPVCPSAPQVHLNTSQCPPSPSQPIPVYPSISQCSPLTAAGARSSGRRRRPGPGSGGDRAGGGDTAGTSQGGVLGDTGRDWEGFGRTGRDWEGTGDILGALTGAKISTLSASGPFFGGEGEIKGW